MKLVEKLQLPFNSVKAKVSITLSTPKKDSRNLCNSIHPLVTAEFKMIYRQQNNNARLVTC